MSSVKKSSFRRLLELGDKEHKKLLSDFYIVSESRIDNFLGCLENGKKEIERLKAQNKHMREAFEEIIIKLGSDNQVTPTPDFITCARTIAEVDPWHPVTWAPELGVFCSAVPVGNDEARLAVRIAREALKEVDDE